MLNERLYTIGSKYNLITKYNIHYDKVGTLNYVCAAHIADILELEYPLNNELESKLTELFNKLIVL